MLRTILRHWLTYYLLAWLAALSSAGVVLYIAWHSFDNYYLNAQRPDGNCGHATIDFGGQWLMGRMLVTGHGRQLYNRNIQRAVLQAAYPDGDQEPGKKSDSDQLMEWLMGTDSKETAEAAATFALPLGAANPWQEAVILASWDKEQTQQRLQLATRKQVGGPLYPPVNAFFYSPLGLLGPRPAYHLQQIANLLLAFFAGLGISCLSRGRFWWPIATIGLLVFPGFFGSITLGQNSTVTLTILIWGWVLAERGWPGWGNALGGTLWGLLAFKPVWALAFFLVPFLSRRWWFCLAMVVTGSTLALLTLPFVGLESWFDWLKIGHDAAQLYNVDQNWIFLSRDLLGIPRRWLLDFGIPNEDRAKNWLMPSLIGWGLLLLIFEATVRLAVLRRRQAAASDGPSAAFLFLGAWMSCYHFMYYDALLAALPVFLLFTQPQHFLEPMILSLAWVRRGFRHPEILRDPWAAPPRERPLTRSLSRPAYRRLWVMNRMAPTFLLLLLAVQTIPWFQWGWLSEGPWKTFFLMWQWLVENIPWLQLGWLIEAPWDTFFLMGLWLWCGWLWARQSVGRQGDKETRRQGDKETEDSPCLLVSLSPCLPIPASNPSTAP